MSEFMEMIPRLPHGSVSPDRSTFKTTLGALKSGGRGFRYLLEVVVGEKSTVALGFEPVIEVDLIQKRCDHLFS